MSARFERYARTEQHNVAINARQFRGCADASALQQGIGTVDFQPPPIQPNTLYDDPVTFRVGPDTTVPVRSFSNFTSRFEPLNVAKIVRTSRNLALASR